MASLLPEDPSWAPRGVITDDWGLKHIDIPVAEGVQESGRIKRYVDI